MTNAFDEALASPESFARLLRFFRVRAGLSQVDLATMAGLSARTISDLERGVRRRAYLPTVHALAAALALTPEERQLFSSTVQRARMRRSLAQAFESNLVTDPPRPPSPFVGREKELEALVRCIDSGESRLVSVTGPPGAGKSRLAIEAGRLLSEHDFRVRYVNIAAANTWSKALASMAGDMPSASDVQVPSPRVVLIIDNLDQLGSAASELPLVLEQSPQLHVLATTRVAGLVRGEYEVHLEPLPLPDEDESDAESVLASPPVRMLTSHSTDNLESMDLPAAIQTLRTIVRRLDGLPLALRTFTQHTSSLSLHEVAAGLNAAEESLVLVALRESERAVFASAEASYELLTPEDQWAFRRLALLGNVWTLDDAADFLLTGDHPPGTAINGRQAYGTLHRIAQHSLLQVDAGPLDVRFRMLSIIRRFALNLLETEGEAEGTRDTLLACALHLCRDAHAGLSGADANTWRRLLMQRAATLGAAVDECLGRSDHQTAVELLWGIRAPIVEELLPAEPWLTQAMSSGLRSPSHEGKLLILAACLRAKRGYCASAWRLVRRGLQLLALTPWDRIEALQLLPPRLASLVRDGYKGPRTRAV